jgi:hypothetical protein
MRPRIWHSRGVTGSDDKRSRRSWRRRFLRLFLFLLALLAVGLAVVKFNYGRGEAYPDVNTEPLVAADDVETVVELDRPLGNVTVSHDGRVFFNVHPFAASHRYADAFLFELVDGQPVPYPDQATQSELQFTFGMTTDPQGRLWLTAPATLERERTRIIAFDLASGNKTVDHELDPGVGRFAQDLRVSADGKTMYMADTGAFQFTPGYLLVIDLETWSVQTRLRGHPSTQPQDWYIQTDHGPHRVGYGLLTFSVGVDGIALSPAGDWLYYAAMSNDTLYRVPATLLRLPDATEEEIFAAVERVGRKPLSDGIEVDAHGNVLLTDVEHGSLVRIGPTGALQTVFRMPQIVWSDGVSVTPGGDIYVTDSAIPSYIDPLLRPPAEETIREHAPYGLYRVRSGQLP